MDSGTLQLTVELWYPATTRLTLITPTTPLNLKALQKDKTNLEPPYLRHNDLVPSFVGNVCEDLQRATCVATVTTRGTHHPETAAAAAAMTAATEEAVAEAGA